MVEGEIPQRDFAVQHEAEGVQGKVDAMGQGAIDRGQVFFIRRKHSESKRQAWVPAHRAFL